MRHSWIKWLRYDSYAAPLDKVFGESVLSYMYCLQLSDGFYLKDAIQAIPGLYLINSLDM